MSDLAFDDARMVRCPYCDTLKMPETDHKCERKSRED